MVKRQACVLAGLALCLASLALALDFPPLTGRVVDQANIMTAQSRTELETKLRELEDKSSIQLVVATMKSLRGGAVDALTARMHDVQIAAGFIAAIQRCGDVLATHAPPDGSSNELPDRLYVI
jgi:uncharacterized membrane protein YgcG